MKKKKQTEPLVTSVASVIKHFQDTRPFTADEIRAEKREMHAAVKEAFDVFVSNLRSGQVDVSSALDLERLVKLAMLLMGEPEGVPQAEENETTVTFSQPLSLDDPDVKSVYERLSRGYNDRNDARES